MAVLDSPLTSYSDTDPHKRQITDVISLIDPSDAVVVQTLGGLDGAAGKFRFVNEKHTKVEWLEDTLPVLTDALNGTISSSATSVVVDDGDVFQPGMILLVDSEYIWVSAVSTNTLTATRNFGGTQASHANNAVVYIVSMARLEGDDSDPLAFTDRTAPYNYTQIFHHEVEVTGTLRELAQYGIPEEMQYQMNKSIPHLMRLVNKSVYHGQRKSGSATTPRGMGGFATFITDNTVAFVTSAVTQANIEDALEAAYNDGGTGPWNLYMAPQHMQVIKNFYDSSSYLRVDRMENEIGMVIDKIITPFGQANFIMDRDAPTDKIWVIDPKNAGFKTYRPFHWDPLAKTGDKDTVEVVGEFTLCVRQDKSHAVLT